MDKNSLKEVNRLVGRIHSIARPSSLAATNSLMPYIHNISSYGEDELKEVAYKIVRDANYLAKFYDYDYTLKNLSQSLLIILHSNGFTMKRDKGGVRLFDEFGNMALHTIIRQLEPLARDIVSSRYPDGIPDESGESPESWFNNLSDDVKAKIKRQNALLSQRNRTPEPLVEYKDPWRGTTSTSRKPGSNPPLP